MGEKTKTRWQASMHSICSGTRGAFSTSLAAASSSSPTPSPAIIKIRWAMALSASNVQWRVKGLKSKESKFKCSYIVIFNLNRISSTEGGLSAETNYSTVLRRSSMHCSSVLLRASGGFLDAGNPMNKQVRLHSLKKLEVG